MVRLVGPHLFSSEAGPAESSFWGKIFVLSTVCDGG